MSNPRQSNGARRRANRARMAAEGRGCWICEAFGRPAAIDYSLPARHPMAFELDELVPVSRYWLGGYSSREECALDYANNAAAHRCCNQWRGNRTVAEVMAIARSRKAPGKGAKGKLHAKGLYPPSRDWRVPGRGRHGVGQRRVGSSPPHRGKPAPSA